MSDENVQQLRVLHIVSAGGAEGAVQQSLFMPLLTRLPKARVKAQVVCLSPGAAPAAVLRQNGVPVHDVALSRKRFSMGALNAVLRAAKGFRPDVVQAWGHTAQIAATLLRARFEGKPKLVWSIAETAPILRNAGFIDRRKLKLAAKLAIKADRIVYTSEAAASQHRRAGFPDGGHLSIPPGVDAMRFKPDPAARRKLRERLELAPDAFVIGMLAPFQPEYDHATFLKAAGELIKTNPSLAVVLAGHGVQRGNAPLMALVGGGALATRTHLLGEWSDAASLFNACDVVCSSATTDRARMTLAMAMLCGVPCVATGMGAQGELIGHFGVAVEPGSPSAFVKGVTRVMQLAPERRQHMVQGARKHALNEYVYVRSLQKYVQLYFDLIGREAVPDDVVKPVQVEVDAAFPVSPAVEEAATPAQPKEAVVSEIADPDSLEARAPGRTEESLPNWRIEQEQKLAALATPSAHAAAADGDVLELFESSLSAPAPEPPPAAGPEEEFAELLSPEALAAEAAPIDKAPSQSKPITRPIVQEEPTKLDAAARMRAAAREELKRAAAAMSASQKKPSPSPQPPAAGELQLELLPDEAFKHAGGRG